MISFALSFSLLFAIVLGLGLPSAPIPLFDGKTFDGWIQKPLSSWDVNSTDASMASLGTGRGFIYTTSTSSSPGKWGDYRLTFTMRHLRGSPDHQACVLIFNINATLDALGGVQFQVPNGGHWDYRPGHNDDGEKYFTKPGTTSFNVHEWSQVELLVNASTGTARMAVAQPVGSKAVENLAFKDVPTTIPKISPIAWQMHNSGLFDEYKDVTIEENPMVNDLITTKRGIINSLN